MNNLLIDHAGHVQKTIALLDAETAYWRLNGRLWQGLAGYSAKLLGTTLDVRLMARDLRALANQGVIDESGLMADTLLAMQQLMHAHYLEFMAEQWQGFAWHQTLALWPVRGLLRHIHRRLGRLRQYVLEHDADADGLSPAGPFTEPSQLLRHLDGL